MLADLDARLDTARANLKAKEERAAEALELTNMLRQELDEMKQSLDEKDKEALERVKPVDSTSEAVKKAEEDEKV